MATYSSAHSGIAHNEEANRLAKIGPKYAKNLKKGKIINMATAKAKAKSLSLQTWASRWERQAGTRCQYLVPEITISTLKQRKMLLKSTSSSMVRKIFRLKCGHNLLSASNSRFDATENPNYAECGVKYDMFHLLMNCKDLDLYQNNLKTMVNDTLQMHCDKSVTMNTNILLEETVLQAQAFLTITILLIDFLMLLKDIPFLHEKMT